MKTNGDAKDFYVGAKWCSHDDGKSFHLYNDDCRFREELIRHNNPAAPVYVTAVDESAGTITLSTTPNTRPKK